MISDHFNSHRHPNTDLCVDVKTFLLEDRIAELGKRYQGTFIRDKESHYTCTEQEPIIPEKRNPRVFNGQYVTITRRDDGTLRPNFKMLATLASDFSLEKYTRGVYEELHMALRMNMNVRP